jgi:hypothetical protein
MSADSAAKHEITQGAKDDGGTDEHRDTQPDECRVAWRIRLEVSSFEIRRFGIPCAFTGDDFELGRLKRRIDNRGARDPGAVICRAMTYRMFRTIE